MDEMKNVILMTIDDSIVDFFYYDRKEDGGLPSGAIEAAVKAGTVTRDEIVGRFAHQIDAYLKED